MKVKKTGDGLAVAIPDWVVETLGLKEGDEVDVSLAGLHALEVDRKMTREQAIERLKQISQPLPAGFKFDRLEANDR